MKLIQKNTSSKDGSGNILLIAETPKDLWHAYNLLQPPTDLVRYTTLRKVINTTSTGSTSSEKKRLNLTIRVSKVDFDPVSMSIRLSGQNVGESNHVRMGAHHTLTLETGRKFSIEKECWDQVYLDRIEEACVPEKGAEICGIVMQPGLAHLCLGACMSLLIMSTFSSLLLHTVILTVPFTTITISYAIICFIRYFMCVLTNSNLFRTKSYRIINHRQGQNRNKHTQETDRIVKPSQGSHQVLRHYLPSSSTARRLLHS